MDINIERKIEMPNITGKELAYIEDQLSHEEMLVKKYQAASNQCSDQALKTKFTQVAKIHQQHYQTLLNHLQ